MQAGSELLILAWLPLDKAVSMQTFGIRVLQGTMPGVHHDTAIVTGSKASLACSGAGPLSAWRAFRADTTHIECEDADIRLTGFIKSRRCRQYHYVTVCKGRWKILLVNPASAHLWILISVRLERCEAPHALVGPIPHTVATIHDLMQRGTLHDLEGCAIPIAAVDTALAQHIAQYLYSQAPGTSVLIFVGAGTCWACFNEQILQRQAAVEEAHAQKTL